jgi:DNA-binding MarR family transcriptional regulator
VPAVAPGPSTSSVGREAWRSLYDLFFSAANHQRPHEACEALDLSPGLMKALLSIQPGQAKPMKSLSAEWRCDPSYVTSLVDGLEERGIVARQAHPTDRRAKTIALTPHGEQTRKALLAQLHEPPPFFAVLTDAEQRALREVLAKLVDAAAEREGDAVLEAQRLLDEPHAGGVPGSSSTGESPQGSTR